MILFPNEPKQTSNKDEVTLRQLFVSTTIPITTRFGIFQSNKIIAASEVPTGRIRKESPQAADGDSMFRLNSHLIDSDTQTSLQAPLPLNLFDYSYLLTIA